MQRKIMIVEDDRDAQRLFEIAIARVHAAKAFLASDGEQALRALGLQGAGRGAPQGGGPALVILDLDLPKMGGLDVLRRIRADPRHKALPVVVFTSTGLDRSRGEALEAGATAYVRKPVEYDEFVAAVGEICQKWLPP